MRRRAFMQAGAVASVAALFCPTVLLRQSVSREALLQKFCLDDYSSIYSIETPFNVGSLTYATNGREIVRCELVNTLDDGAALPRPPVQRCFKQLWRPAGELRPVERPALDDLVESDCMVCPVCFNRRVSVDINDTDLILKYWADWDEDDSTFSDHTCGWHWDPVLDRRRDMFGSLFALEGCYFSYANIVKIFDLPNVRMSVRRESARDSYLYFRGDGFQGIACGVRRGRHDCR